MRLRSKVVAVFASWTALALILGLNRFIRINALGDQTTLWAVMRPSLLDYWIWAGLTFAVFAFARHIPFTRRRLGLAIAAHAGLCVAVSLVHVTMAEVIGLPLATVKEFGGSRLEARFLLNFYSDIWMYWPLVGLWNLVEYQRRFRERAMRAAQLESQLAKAQLEVLRNQLQPHFLFNTLNSISALMQDDPEAAEDMLADLSYILRGSLRSNSSQEITLQREMDLLEAYVRIQQKRFEDRLDFIMDVPEDTLEALVPALVLQPIVENAIRHGITPLSRKGCIRIHSEKQTAEQFTGSGAGSASLEEARLLLRVEDDGAGLAADYSEGIGLSNTRQRLQQLYGSGASLRLDGASGRGTRVEILLPFRPAEFNLEMRDDENSDTHSRRRTPGPPESSLAAHD